MSRVWSLLQALVVTTAACSGPTTAGSSQTEIQEEATSGVATSAPVVPNSSTDGPSISAPSSTQAISTPRPTTAPTPTRCCPIAEDLRELVESLGVELLPGGGGNHQYVDREFVWDDVVYATAISDDSCYAEVGPDMFSTAASAHFDCKNGLNFWIVQWDTEQEIASELLQAVARLQAFGCLRQ